MQIFDFLAQEGAICKTGGLWREHQHQHHQQQQQLQHDHQLQQHMDQDQHHQTDNRILRLVEIRPVPVKVKISFNGETLPQTMDVNAFTIQMRQIHPMHMLDLIKLGLWRS